MLHIIFISFYFFIFNGRTINANVLNKLEIQEKEFRTVQDHISGVTNLVTEALKNMANGSSGTKSKISPLFTGFLKLLGLDPNNIVAIALNGVIFLAQMMGSLIVPKPNEELRKSEPEMGSDISLENPFDWIWQNQEITNRVNLLTNKDLSENVITYIKEKSQDEGTSCVQLLICKIAPFIWKMQSVLTSENSLGDGYAFTLFHFIPTREELRKQSDLCNERFAFCI